MPPNVTSANILLISLEFWWGWRRKSIFKEKTHREGFLAAYISLSTAQVDSHCFHTGRRGRSAKLTARAGFCLCSEKLIVYHLLGKPMPGLSLVSHLKESLGFQDRESWKEPWRSPDSGAPSPFLQKLPSERVLRIMTNVSSNRLLPSVSGRRQPRALATATGNS